MKRREFLKLSATMAGAAVTIYMPSAWRPAKAAAKWKVGFSQCTTLEPWRVQFNKDIQAEAKKYLVSAIERVAQRLGNTPAVCRKCYIHPAIMDAYLEGRTAEVLK